MQECHSVFYYFPTENSSLYYRAKKKMKPGIRVKLDLTKSRCTLLTDTCKFVNPKSHNVMLTLIVGSKLSGLVSLSTTILFQHGRIAGNSRQSLDVDKKELLLSF